MQNRPPLMLKYRRESRAPRRRLLIFPTRAKFHALLRHRPRASTKISSIPWPTEHANSKLHVTRNTSMTFPAKSPVRSIRLHPFPRRQSTRFGYSRLPKAPETISFLFCIFHAISGPISDNEAAGLGCRMNVYLCRLEEIDRTLPAASSVLKESLLSPPALNPLSTAASLFFQASASRCFTKLPRCLLVFAVVLSSGSVRRLIHARVNTREFQPPVHLSNFSSKPLYPPFLLFRLVSLTFPQ